jgi:alkanesulfonate monooxygenase SsuD/methylene tetrahydromethanopterin reductase-like flavin-dependent oxidoreductase (luciferase family)
MRLAMRFDMRAPDFGAPAAELYAASLDMAEWADQVGFDAILFSEHHGADDGYCPAPIVHASAVAARTRRIELRLSALLVPLRHPVQTAEELAVLDIVSDGRAAVTLGLGYRPFEFAMYGRDMSGRVAALEAAVELFGRAWTGEPFEVDGVPALVRPVPVQKPGPPLFLAGTTPASARRAARLGVGYDPAPSYDARSLLYDVYERERARLGLPAPPPYLRPGPRFLFVTDDPEGDWDRHLPHLAHQTNSYAQWRRESNADDVLTSPWKGVTSLDEVRADPAFAVLTPEQTLALADDLGPQSELVFHPLIGGTPPQLAWRGLRAFAEEVLPELRARGLVASPG